MDYTIYAVDFDGTLCENLWPEIGAPNEKLIEFLKQRRSEGDKVILWTCRTKELLQEAIEWCEGFSLEFDAVNANLPEMVDKFYGGESRKVFANVYIDDKMGVDPEYNVPFYMHL